MGMTRVLRRVLGRDGSARPPVVGTQTSGSRHFATTYRAPAAQEPCWGRAGALATSPRSSFCPWTLDTSARRRWMSALRLAVHPSARQDGSHSSATLSADALTRASTSPRPPTHLPSCAGHVRDGCRAPRVSARPALPSGTGCVGFWRAVFQHPVLRLACGEAKLSATGSPACFPAAAERAAPRAMPFSSPF